MDHQDASPNERETGVPPQRRPADPRPADSYYRMLVERVQDTIEADVRATGVLDADESFEHAGGNRSITSPLFTDDIALRIVAAG